MKQDRLKIDRIMDVITALHDPYSHNQSNEKHSIEMPLLEFTYRHGNANTLMIIQNSSVTKPERAGEVGNWENHENWRGAGILTSRAEEKNKCISNLLINTFFNTISKIFKALKIRSLFSSKSTGYKILLTLNSLDDKI